MLVEPSYIEQTLPQSMHVWMNLNFIAYIANQYFWWSFHYIYSTMQSMQGKCLRTKPKHEAQFYWNPWNFSPIGIHYQNGQKGLEGEYSESSSSRCACPKKKWKHMLKSKDKNLEEIKLYLGSNIANKMGWHDG
jgi:hypothetical protein